VHFLSVIRTAVRGGAASTLTGLASSPIRLGASAIRPDSRQDDVAGAERLIDIPTEVDAIRTVVDIAKDRLATIPRHQPIEDPPGYDAEIRAAMGDYDLRHRSASVLRDQRFETRERAI